MKKILKTAHVYTYVRTNVRTISVFNVKNKTSAEVGGRAVPVGFIEDLRLHLRGSARPRPG